MTLRTLAIGLVVIDLCVFKLTQGNAYVTLQNEFVMLKTKDSGTFVGGQETFPVWPINPNNNSNSTSKIYYAFRGIPYAKPPIGSLRWKDPEPPDVTAGPKDATKFKSICPQWDDVKNELIGNPDCLYLNIFTPRLHFSIGRGQSEAEELSPYDEDPRHAIRRLPILVYIHSGQFIKGSGDISHYQHFLDENVLLVTFNYRLGLFTFPPSGHSTLNIGILDQIAALKWIRKNIHRFGGDPNRVTVFGEIGFLLESSLISDLYQGLIYMPSPISNQKVNSTHFYTKLFDATKCSDINCLEVVPVNDLIMYQKEFMDSELSPGSFSPGEVERSSTTLNITIPIMIGVNVVEGFEPFSKFWTKYQLSSTLPHTLTQQRHKFRLMVKSNFPKISTRAVDTSWNFYFGNYSFPANDDLFFNKTLQLFGDIYVYNKNWDLVETLSRRGGPTFYYVFDKNSDKVETFLKNDKLFASSYPWEEEYFLFQNFNESSNAGDVKMRKILVKIWTSFAAYGTPKSALAKEKGWGKWNQITEQSPQAYYHFNIQNSNMKTNFRSKEVEFWKNILPEVDPSEETKEPTSVRFETEIENKGDIKHRSDMTVSSSSNQLFAKYVNAVIILVFRHIIVSNLQVHKLTKVL